MWLRLHLITEKLHHKCSRARNANWNDNNGNVNSNVNNSNNQNDNLGSRGVIRVYILCTDFNQPPSILPISCASDCIWKTLVSLTSFSSSIKRNLSVRTSRVPLDFNKQAAFIVLGAFLAITSCSSNESMLNSVLFPSVSLHLFVIWSLTSLKCLYSS